MSADILWIMGTRTEHTITKMAGESGSPYVILGPGSSGTPRYPLPHNKQHRGLEQGHEESCHHRGEGDIAEECL